jgi:glutaredoxin
MLALLVPALFFGGLPAARQYLYGLTVEEGHGQQIKTPVIMYTTQWCPHCQRALEYFKRHSVNYIEYNIEASTENLAKFRDLNGTGIPLILAGGKRMQGFSPKSFDDLLK